MLLFAALIAGSFSLGGQAAAHVDPAALTALRFVAAAGLMAGLLLALGPGLRARDYAQPWRFAALGGLLALYFILMFEALRIAEPVSTGAVFTLIPLMSAGFAWPLLGPRTAPLALAALMLGAAGAVWVIFGADPERLLAFAIGRGEAIFFVGCAAHAFYAPLVRRLNRGEPLLAFTFATLVGGAAAATLWGAPALAATDWAALPPIVWLTAAYLAVFTTAGTFFLLQFAALRLPAGKVMAYGYLTPGFVALYEGLAGRGWPAPGVWLGMGLTAAALLMLLGRDEG